MTYDTLKDQFGKTAVQIVEIYMDRCTRTYGSSPCTAVLGTTGPQKCFNTFNTCQDKANYLSSPKIYRFATTRVDNIQAPGDGPTFPTLLNVDTAPTVLTPGTGLGIRSSLNITIEDHPWTDAGVDPYLSSRGYDPNAKGTFWGKFLTRNKFYQNRRVDVLTGFLDDDGLYQAANFKRRTYIISKISGPTVNGTISLEATDPLRLADGEKAKWPRASTATLTGNITNTDTLIGITDADLSISDWYTAGGRYIRIQDEIMNATSISGSGTPTPVLTVVRAQMPAIYVATKNIGLSHPAGSSVQPCWYFDDKVYDIVYFLLNVVAGIDSAYLPLADWTTEVENGFSYLTFKALLTDPVDVKTLLTEITQLNILIWWHERDSEVKLKPLRFQVLAGDQVNDDDSIIGESVALTEDAKNFTSQLWTYFNISWPLANPDLLWEYTTDVRANFDRENADQYGKPGIRTVKTRWLHAADSGTVAEIGFTTLRQYQDVRKLLSWTMDAKDDSFWVGDTVGVTTKYIQDQFGDPAPKNYLVTQVNEQFSQAGVRFQYTAMELFYFARTGNITHPSGAGGDPTLAPPNYSLASAEERTSWCYISPDTPTDAPVFADGTAAYQIV